MLTFIRATFLHEYVPQKLLHIFARVEDWVPALRASHEVNKGKTPEQCKQEYVDHAKSLPLYGVSIYPCEVCVTEILDLNFF